MENTHEMVKMVAQSAQMTNLIRIYCRNVRINFGGFASHSNQRVLEAYRFAPLSLMSIVSKSQRRGVGVELILLRKRRPSSIFSY